MTGFRFVSPAARVFKTLRTASRASDFAPDVKLFLKRSLTTAIQLTPARSLQLINKAQRTQYAHRINYIPSFHELLNPTLIVKGDGSQWLYCGRKWYRPDEWHLPDAVWSEYQTLIAERDRRMDTSREDFVKERAQARFLYKRSWWEIGQSVGIDVPCSQQVKDSHSRRTPSQLRNGHKQNPPKGYAMERGGKDIYSIVVVNPFLEQTTAYWVLSGKSIIAEAMQKHRAKFEERVADKQAQLILRILRDLLA